jgi:hypothetical protein
MSIDSQVKKRTAMGKEIEGLLNQLSAKMAEYNALSISIYKQIPNPDCLPGDSPISPARNENNLRRHLAKLGFKWAFALPFGVTEVKPFSEEAKDGGKWALKFEPAPTLDKLV